MSGYSYACPTCSQVHAIDHPIFSNYGTASSLPDRSCDHCGSKGCVDCISLAGLCPTCFQNMLEGQAHIEGACRPDCLACVNGWSHG